MSSCHARPTPAEPSQYDGRPPLQMGLIVHVRTKGVYGWAIRHALNRWHKAYCVRTRKKFAPVWGNHDGLIVPCDESPSGRGVAEAMPGGSRVTPWEHYLENMLSGKCQVRRYQVKASLHPQATVAVMHWLLNENNKPYDWKGIWRLWGKTLAYDFSDEVKSWEWADWCTEYVGNSYLAAGIDVFQTRHPTPLTVEQVAGELSRKDGKRITLQRIA